MVARLVVFRFDHDPLVCRSRVRLLRRLNPGVPIVGLYGGEAGLRRIAHRLGSRPILTLDSFFASPRAGRWNWQHGDLALAAWYRAVGRLLPFDVVHLVEWDMLLLAPLDELYRHVPPDAVGLTAHTRLADVADNWEWMQRPGRRAGSERLLEHARREWQFAAEPHACIAGGPSIPRAFLAQYAELDVADVGHDELRLPLFAEILGFPVVDTGLRRSWEAAEEDRFFNATGQEIAEATILSELDRPDGRRAFHPVRRILRSVEG
jgi:hypothetical protein